MAYQAKITRARFVLGPFSAEQMQAIGQVAADSIKTRILAGVNVQDQPSKALKPGYLKRKVKGAQKGHAPLRDWFFRGVTLGSLKVKSADENRVTVGFVNDQADRIAHINNLREKAFGVSPNDRKAVNAAVLATLKQFRIIRFRKAA